jgi:hypothetical protein
MASSKTQEHVSTLIHGLQKRGIDFVVSDSALGCQLTEVYITQAQELLLFPPKRTDSTTLRWILEIRTPLNVRLTFFPTDVTKFKTQLLQAISAVQDNGLIIPNIDHAISIQELSEHNIHRLLDSLEGLDSLDVKSRPLPAPQSNIHSTTVTPSSFETKKEVLHVHLRNAIKTYWTERYFARYLNTPRENIEKIAKRIGIQREVCGRETIYFFERPKALRTYFTHIVKGLLTELNLQYRETLTHEFYLLDLKLGLHFFDGEIDQLRILAKEYTNNHELIIVVPETLKKHSEQIRDEFFEVLPLDQDKLRSTLIKALQQRFHHIPAYSSGTMK